MPAARTAARPTRTTVRAPAVPRIPAARTRRVIRSPAGGDDTSGRSRRPNAIPARASVTNPMKSEVSAMWPDGDR
jgi:hypothetical protein